MSLERENWLIEDKTFIITGAANGLGAAYVENFLRDGAKNIAILDVAEDAGKELSQKLNEIFGNKTVFVKCDVTKEEDIDRAFKEVLKEWKQIDVIINNAGIMNDAEPVWRKACDVNWQGVVSFTRRGVSHMRKDGGGAGGTIVNVSSIAGFLKLPIIPAYAGSKAAVLHFSLSLSDPPFYEKTGIRILTMCPGPTRTTLMQDLVEKSIDEEVAANVEIQFPYAQYQSVESAVTGMVKMLRDGQNGSVWISSRGRSAEDITHLINNFHLQLANVVTNGLEQTSERQ